MIIAGNRIYEICSVCGKMVQLNKWLFSDLHLCLTDEEQKAQFMKQLMPGGASSKKEEMGKGVMRCVGNSRTSKKRG